MRKLLKNQIFRNLISALSFGACYSLIAYIDKGYVDIDIILVTMATYFLIMCLLCFIAPKLRRITGHDKNNDL